MNANILRLSVAAIAIASLLVLGAGLSAEPGEPQQLTYGPPAIPGGGERAYGQHAIPGGAGLGIEPYPEPNGIGPMGEPNGIGPCVEPNGARIGPCVEPYGAPIA